MQVPRHFRPGGHLGSSMQVSPAPQPGASIGPQFGGRGGGSLKSVPINENMGVGMGAFGSGLVGPNGTQRPRHCDPGAHPGFSMQLSPAPQPGASREPHLGKGSGSMISGAIGRSVGMGGGDFVDVLLVGVMVISG